MKKLSISISQNFLTDEKLLFIIMILIHLVPVWAFNYFPSQDGPVHLANSRILHDLLFNDKNNIFREFFNLNTADVSNWLTHLLIMILNIFLPILIAEKVYLSGYIILLPLSVRFALSNIKFENKYLSFMIFPFAYNLVFHKGFYSYIYSLAFFFYLIGFWLRYRESLNYNKTVIIGLLSLLTYLFHIVSFVSAFVVISILSIQEILKNALAEKLEIPKLLHGTKYQFLYTLLSFFPTFLLILAFLNKHGTYKSYDKPFFYKFVGIVGAKEPLCSFNHYEEITSAGVFFLFLSVSFFALEIKTRCKKVRDLDSLFIAALCSLLIYFIAPDSISGGNVISPRLSLYPFFILILWFGNTVYSLTIKRYIVAGSIVLALLSLGIHSFSYAKANGYIQQYVKGFNYIQNNSTLLPLHYKNRVINDAHVKIFLHLSHYITSQKKVVNFGNYQANKGFFPIIWKEELNPYKDLSKHIHSITPEVDLITYLNRTKKDVDYVLVWGDHDDFKDNSGNNSIFGQLAERYNLVYQNRDKLLLRVYRRNK